MRERLVIHGLQHAQTFTWDRSAALALKAMQRFAPPVSESTNTLQPFNHGDTRVVPTSLFRPRTLSIVILKLDHLGDFILAIPAITKLRSRYPQAQIDAVVGSLSMHVVSSDGSMRVALQPSRYDLHCPVKTLSLYFSDRLLDYALPFLSSVLGPAVSMLNPQQLVDKLIQQHAGKDFSISTGAEALHLFLGDSSAAQLFVPLFDVSARVSCLCSVLRFNVAPRSRLSTQHRKWMLSTKQ
jgi:hypothetical protein